MNKFYRRLFALILLVLVISGVVIYTTIDINSPLLWQLVPWLWACFLMAAG